MFLTSPFIDQAISRFDLWSVSAKAMLQQRSTRAIPQSLTSSSKRRYFQGREAISPGTSSRRPSISSDQSCSLPVNR